MQRLSEGNYRLVRRSILGKLHSAKCWHKGHMLFERFKSGLPGHLKGDVDSVLRDLLKEELVLFYGKTKHGDAYQLNIKKLKEIEDAIKSC